MRDSRTPSLDAQRVLVVTHTGAAHPANLATNQAKGSVLPPETRRARSAGCHESGSSSATEAHRSNPSRLKDERSIPVFYPMRMTLAEKGDADRPRPRMGVWPR